MKKSLPLLMVLRISSAQSIMHDTVLVVTLTTGKRYYTTSDIVFQDGDIVSQDGGFVKFTALKDIP